MSYFGGQFRQNQRRYLDPRTLTGGRSAYVFRRETCLRQEPSLSVATRLKEKEGIIFSGARDFWSLEDDSRLPSSSSGGVGDLCMDRYSLEDIQQLVDEQKQDSKKKKKKNPSPEYIRNYLRKIIAFHEKMVRDSLHCAYPLISEILEQEQNNNASAKQDTKETYNQPTAIGTSTNNGLTATSIPTAVGKGQSRKRKKTPAATKGRQKKKK